MSKKVKFEVPTMNCQSCVSKIKNALAELNPTELSFDVKAKSVDVVFDEASSSALNLKKKIESIGFSVTKMDFLK